MPRACNKAVFPQQTTPGRWWVDIIPSHAAVLSPPRTDPNFYSGQYFVMFPRVSGPELVTRLCLHSSEQHRVGRASTCFHRAHSVPTQTTINRMISIVLINIIMVIIINSRATYTLHYGSQHQSL